MKKIDRHYLTLSLQLLQRWLSFDCNQMLDTYEKNGKYSIEFDMHNYVYCIFSYPYENCGAYAERILLFVYDGDQIIADISCIYTDICTFLQDQTFYNDICQENDWTYFCHAVLSQYMFPSFDYPLGEVDSSLRGVATIITSAYVTKEYRRKHIFTTMMSCLKEFILTNQSGSLTYYSSISLDPDLASYGKDTMSSPYLYSMADEPVRKQNGEIMKKFGYIPIRLDPEDTNQDGAKLWYALLKEQELIIEQNENMEEN